MITWLMNYWYLLSDYLTLSGGLNVVWQFSRSKSVKIDEGNSSLWSSTSLLNTPEADMVALQFLKLSVTLGPCLLCYWLSNTSHHNQPRHPPFTVVWDYFKLVYYHYNRILVLFWGKLQQKANSLSENDQVLSSFYQNTAYSMSMDHFQSHCMSFALSF